MPRHRKRTHVRIAAFVLPVVLTPILPPRTPFLPGSPRCQEGRSPQSPTSLISSFSMRLTLVVFVSSAAVARVLFWLVCVGMTINGGKRGGRETGVAATSTVSSRRLVYLQCWRYNNNHRAQKNCLCHYYTTQNTALPPALLNSEGVTEIRTLVPPPLPFRTKPIILLFPLS